MEKQPLNLGPRRPKPVGNDLVNHFAVDVEAMKPEFKAKWLRLDFDLAESNARNRMGVLPGEPHRLEFAHYYAAELMIQLVAMDRKTEPECVSCSACIYADVESSLIDGQWVVNGRRFCLCEGSTANQPDSWYQLCPTNEIECSEFKPLKPE